jgi:hypothetical protein
LSAITVVKEEMLVQIRVVHEDMRAQFALLREGSGAGANPAPGKRNGPKV